MELTIAVIGTIVLTLPALERLFLAKENGHSHERKRKRRVVYAIVIGALALNISLNWIQYANVKIAALNKQKSLEGALALSLWAFANREEIALRYLTSNSESTAPTNPYLLGYYYLREGLLHSKLDDIVLAKDKFEVAIGNGTFVAPSHYLLAVVEQKKAEDRTLGENERKDHLKNAMDSLKKGMDYDSNFSSLYVGRAMVSAMQDQTEAALADLEKAVSLSKIHCYTVNRNAPDQQHPLHRLYTDPRFQHLLTECRIYERKLSGVSSTQPM